MTQARPDPQADRQRRCIATGESAPREELLRFVLSPDGVVTPDLAEKLPGRGAWVTGRREALELAIKRGAFSRAFEAKAAAPDGLAELIDRQLAAAALSRLGLARRAGEAVVGFDAVERLLRAGKAGALIGAQDGGRDGREKLRRLAGEIEVIGLFDSAALSAALGKERVIHVALKKGALATRFLRDAHRLEAFRAESGVC